MSRPSRPLLLVALLLAAGSLIVLLTDTPAPEPGPPDPGEDVARGEGPPPDPLRSDGSTTTDGQGGSPASGRGTRSGDGAFLTGLVVDGGDRPLSGATVRIFPVDPRSLRGAPYPDGARLAETRSARDGRFRVPAPYDTWLRVVASASGRATVGTLVASTGADVLLRLPPAAPLQVSVRTVEDRPVAGAEVEVRVSDMRATAQSDAEGMCRFAALPPGDALVRARAEGTGRVRAGPFALVSGRDTAATVVLTPAVSVAGTVVDESGGGPIAGARVFVARPGESEAATATGPDGRFGPLHGGGRGERVFLSAAADGYAPALDPVILRQEGVQHVVVRLREAANWSGRVQSSEGVAVQGAWVGYSDDGVAGRAPASTRTDKDGLFTLPPPPPPAPGRRVVLHARHVLGEAALGLRPGSIPPDPLVLELAHGVPVRGRVVDGEGRGLAGVQVRLAPAWRKVGNRSNPDAATSRLLLANEAGFLGFAAATDATGEWWLADVPAGPYEVRFTWSGGRHWRKDVLDVRQGPAQAGTEVLGGGHRLAGRVLDGSGGVVAGVTVRALSQEEHRRVHRTTTDEDGAYAWPALPAGVYRLGASLAQASAFAGPLTLAADVVDADITFDEQAILAGRVLAEGRPYAGLLTIFLRPAGTQQRERPPRSLRVHDGTFRWEGAPVGTWIAEGRAPGKRLGISSASFDVEAGRVASITLTLAAVARLEGRVLTSDGAPAASARVKMLAVAGGRTQLATTDAEGRYIFHDLAPGSYEVTAWGRGGASTHAALGLAVGERRDLELKLAPAGTARVLVVDVRDRPVAGAVVVFRTADGAVPSARPDRTGRDGIAVRPDLPLGDVLVRARAPDGRTGRARVRIEENKTTSLSVRLAE